MAINGKQAQAIAMMIKGTPQKDIAQELNITETTLSKWKKRDDFKQEYREQIEDIMNVAAGEAIETICNLMRNSNSDNVRIKAAQDILNRAGYKPIDKIEAKTDNKNRYENITYIVGFDDNEDELSNEALAKAQKDIKENPDNWISVRVEN